MQMEFSTQKGSLKADMVAKVGVIQLIYQPMESFADNLSFELNAGRQKFTFCGNNEMLCHSEYSVSSLREIVIYRFEFLEVSKTV